MSLLRLFKLLGSDDSTIMDVVPYEGENSGRVSIGHRASFTVHLDAENIGAVTGFMLIDLSDTTNWPHTETGHIVLEKIVVGVNPDTAYVGDIDFGFLSSVDATDGDFNIIGTIHLARSSASSVNPFDFDTFGLDLELGAWFGPTGANDTTWQTDVNIQGPDGATSYPSGDGDFVMKINRSAGNVDVGVTLIYTTKA